MCTAISYKTKDHYFGRNLDLEYSYNETVTITPRNYPFRFRKTGKMESHFAMIGVAFVQDDYPLYYDAVNEKGLSVAGLNFPHNADYKPLLEGKDNVAPFELIPWILGQCATVSQAEKLLRKINILGENFNNELPLTPLHWIVSDGEKSITLEATKTGVKVYDNPVGVLTNNPTFDYHLMNLNNYMSLSCADPENTFAGEKGHLELKTYSRGMGSLGLPGDASSVSRFVRAAFVKANSVCETSEEESVNQFFHILRSVEMPRGCVQVENGLFAVTVYTSCCNTDRGIYYYSTYDGGRIYAVDMHRENLLGNTLINYPMKKKAPPELQN